MVAEAFEKYAVEDMAITWTEVKDSTPVLEIVYQVRKEKGFKLPKCFCIYEWAIRS